MGSQTYSVHRTPKYRTGLCGTPYKFIFVPSFDIDTIFLADNTGRPPYPRLASARKTKFGILRKYTVHKFKNARQARTGRNMVKYSSPNASSTWLIFLCPRTHASSQTCHHSAASVLAVPISRRVITVFVLRKQQEEWRNR